MLMALHFALEANNPYFRVGYNSLGAYATINHLHFQVSVLGRAAPFFVQLVFLSSIDCVYEIANYQ